MSNKKKITKKTEDKKSTYNKDYSNWVGNESHNPGRPTKPKPTKSSKK